MAVVTEVMAVMQKIIVLARVAVALVATPVTEELKIPMDLAAAALVDRQWIAQPLVPMAVVVASEFSVKELVAPQALLQLWVAAEDLPQQLPEVVYMAVAVAAQKMIPPHQEQQAGKAQ
jgi:hypothetical protein